MAKSSSATVISRSVARRLVAQGSAIQYVVYGKPES